MIDNESLRITELRRGLVDDANMRIFYKFDFIVLASEISVEVWINCRAPKQRWALYLVERRLMCQ